MPCPLPLVGPRVVSCQLPSASLGEVRSGLGIGFLVPSKDLARVTPSVVIFLVLKLVPGHVFFPNFV